MNQDKRLNKIKGQYGEDVASQYLLANGYQIITRNYQNKFGEIDIIATIENSIHFVEVKNRSTDLVVGRFAVNRGKQKHIRNTAKFYLHAHPHYQNYFVSFDVIEITDGQIEFLENCFY